MPNKFLEKLKEENNYTRTENLALTHQSTLDPLLDFFSLGGALRARSEVDIIQLFSRAFNSDPLLAMKCLFYFRDIRGGQGERRTFRILLSWLGHNYPNIVMNNIENIAFYGRWDDYYSLAGIGVEKFVFEFMNKQLKEDMDSEQPTLLAKWLKSENTSSRKSKQLARLTMKYFEMKSKQYRKILSNLRRKIRIVESKMCSNKWSEINYEGVPSRASMLYSKAFKKHDEERYNAYIESVKKGEKTIKTATLYPYDLLRQIVRNKVNYKEYSVMWDNLPDYTGEEENSIVVCDTSGSMGSLRWGDFYRPVEPILVSVSLALYFAERAKGPYRNHFITFSTRPQLQEVYGNNLYEKFINLGNADWLGNTDLIAVFKLILMTAIKHQISDDEMIKKIYIISDMEFDACVENRTNFQYIKELYDQAGYTMPTLVFWNVDARQNQAPITTNDQGVFLVSGCSPSIFKNLMASKAMNAYDMMLEVLNSERYERVTL